MKIRITFDVSTEDRWAIGSQFGDAIADRDTVRGYIETIVSSAIAECVFDNAPADCEEE